MDTEEREIQDKTEGAGASNVVRLPRDWLGPREELVPFGPSARGAQAEEPAEPATSANDFWGERSDALHDAVERPSPAPTPGPVAEPAGGPGVGPVAEAAGETVPPRGGQSRARWPVIAALVAAVSVVAVVAVMAPRLVSGSHVSGSSTSPAAGRPLFTAVGGKLARTRVRLRLELRPRAPRPTHPRPPATSATPPRGTVSVSTSSPSATSAPPSASPSYASPHTAVARQPSASASQPVATSSGSAGGGGGGASSGAGPTGEGALVGPASCNC